MRLEAMRRIGLSIMLGGAWLLVAYLIPQTRPYVVFWGPLTTFSFILKPAALLLGDVAACAGFDRWSCPPAVDVMLWAMAGTVVLFVLYLVGLLTFTVARAVR